MSNISPQGEQSTSAEIAELTALTNLAVSGAGQFIQKTGIASFANGTPSGAGTVTSLSVASANGFAGTVATATTTPAITLTTTASSGSILFSNGSALSQDNANLFWDSTNHRLGIGTASPANTLDLSNASLPSGQLALGVTATMSSANATQTGAKFTFTPSGSASQVQTGLWSAMPAGYTGNNYSIALRVSNSTAGTNSGTWGAAANYGLYNQTDGTTSGMNVGAAGIAQNSSGKNVGLLGFTNSGGAMNYGVVGDASSGTNKIGVLGTFSDTPPTGVSAAIMADNAAIAAPIFVARDNGSEIFRIDDGGNVGIGQTSPTAYLHIKAGAAAASSAPLKFTSGINLTTAEAGAMEYDGTSLYFTPTGTTRQTIPYLNLAQSWLAAQTYGSALLIATSPKIVTSIFDTNGNTLINIGATGSAVNYVKVTNAATGTAGPILAADGETNVDLKIAGKGTGAVHATSGTYGDLTNYTPAGAGTATLTLNTSNVHTITMPAGNITIALSNEHVGQIFTIRILQDGVGSRTVTWFTTIKWAGGVAPTLTTTASKADTFVFLVTSAGNYDGYIVGQNL